MIVSTATITVSNFVMTNVKAVIAVVTVVASGRSVLALVVWVVWAVEVVFLDVAHRVFEGTRLVFALDENLVNERAGFDWRVHNIRQSAWESAEGTVLVDTEPVGDTRVTEDVTTLH